MPPGAPPPVTTPRIVSVNPAPYLIAAGKSPKSVPFPVVAIVMNSIVFNVLESPPMN